MTEYIRGYRSVLAILSLAAITATCHGTLYEPTLRGKVLDRVTQDPLDSVTIEVTTYPLVEDPLPDADQHFEYAVTTTDSAGIWQTDFQLENPVGCTGDRDEPSIVSEFYFRLEREGYQTLDTSFAGEFVESQRISGDMFMIPDITLAPDSTN